MPTLTIRVDDQTRDDLEAVANARDEKLSDVLRAAIDIVLDRDDEAIRRVAPPSMSAVERQQLSLLHRILARVVSDDDIDGDAGYQLDRARVLEAGFTREYYKEFIAIQPEMSRRECQLVVDILEMFRAVHGGIRQLKGDSLDEEVRRRLRFDGFDGNHPEEQRLLTYACYLIEAGKWSELAPVFSDENDGGNSHAERLEIYLRMLAAFRPINEARLRDARRENIALTRDELTRLAHARRP